MAKKSNPPDDRLTIAEAMRKGWRNEEIHEARRQGIVRSFANRGEAMQKAPGDYAEMLRRSLI